MSTLLVNTPIYYRKHKQSENESDSNLEKEVVDSFQVVSKDEHILASEFKLVHQMSETTPAEVARKKAKYLQNHGDAFGFFPTESKRLYTMYSLDHVCWIPIRCSK